MYTSSFCIFNSSIDVTKYVWPDSPSSLLFETVHSLIIVLSFAFLDLGEQLKANK